MIRNRIVSLILSLGFATGALSAVLVSEFDGARGQTVKSFAGVERTFRVQFKKHGLPIPISGGVVPMMRWASNATASLVVTNTGYTVVDSTNGIVDFLFSQSALGVSGEFIYMVGLTSGSTYESYGQGAFVLLDSPYSASYSPGYTPVVDDSVRLVAESAVTYASNAYINTSNALSTAEAASLSASTALSNSITALSYSVLSSNAYLNATGAAYRLDIAEPVLTNAYVAATGALARVTIVEGVASGAQTSATSAYIASTNAQVFALSSLSVAVAANSTATGALGVASASSASASNAYLNATGAVARLDIAEPVLTNAAALSATALQPDGLGSNLIVSITAGADTNTLIVADAGYSSANGSYAWNGADAYTNESYIKVYYDADEWRIGEGGSLVHYGGSPSPAGPYTAGEPYFGTEPAPTVSFGTLHTRAAAVASLALAAMPQTYETNFSAAVHSHTVGAVTNAGTMISASTGDFVRAVGGTASNLTMQGVTTRQGYEQDSSGVYKRGYDSGGLYVSGQTQTTPSNVVTRQLLPTIAGVQTYASTAASMGALAYGGVSVMATNDTHSIVWQSLVPPTWATGLVTRMWWTASTNDVGLTAVFRNRYYTSDATNGIAQTSGPISTNTIVLGTQTTSPQSFQGIVTNMFSVTGLTRVQPSLYNVATGQTRTNQIWIIQSEFEWQ
jgi:hypothetical protein